MRRYVGLTLAAALGVLAAACASERHAAPPTSASTSTVAVVAANTCARPAPTPARLVPAAVTRWADGAPVIGSGALWTISAALRAPAVHELGEWRIKFPWFTHPPADDVPSITARRLDGPGTFRFDASRAFDANGNWVASGLIFSASGCWEVTGHYRGSTLTFPLHVEAAD
jgi:hypothetical protein